MHIAIRSHELRAVSTPSVRTSAAERLIREAPESIRYNLCSCIQLKILALAPGASLPELPS